MPSNASLRFKSGSGKSIRIDKVRAQRTKEKKTKLDRFVNLGLTASVFVLSLVFLGSFFVYKSLTQNFASADSFDTFTTSYPSTLYLVVDDFKANPIILKKVVFLILDKNGNKINIFELPIEEKFNFSNKYSDISLKELFMLGGVSSENKIEGGTKLVKFQLFKHFGFNIDNFIVVDSAEESVMNSLIYNGDTIFPFGGLSPKVMQDSFYTSYTFKDFYQFQTFIHDTSFDNTIIKNVNFNEWTSLTDYISSMTLNSNIAKERKTISVLNGTDLPGIATVAGMVINNIGGRVVAMENSSNKREDSVLVVSDMDSETVSYLKHVFHINSVYTKSQASSFITDDALSRSDIVLILGFDLADMLY